MALKTIKTEENGQLSPESAPKNGFLEYVTFLIQIREAEQIYRHHSKVLFNNLCNLNQVIVIENGKES